MKFPLAAVAFALFASAAVSACFKANYDECTRPCAENKECPSDQICRNAFCVNSGSTRMCKLSATEPPPDAPGTEVADADAGEDADAAPPTDAASDVPRDGDDVADGESVDVTPDAPITIVDGDDGNDATGALCRDRCCVRDTCPMFSTPPPRLLLWADRTSLAAMPGFPAPTWFDRSTAGHNIVTTTPESPPFVQSDMVGPIFDIHSRGTIVTTSGSPIQFGIEDFTVLVLASCDQDASRALLFESLDSNPGDRSRTGFSLFCNHPGLETGPTARQTRATLVVTDDLRWPSVIPGIISSSRTFEPGQLHLFGARRVGGTTIQLRVDREPEASVMVPASLDLASQTPCAIASSLAPNVKFAGQVAAVVVIKGPQSDQDVQTLEDFLIQNLGQTASPFPKP